MAADVILYYYISHAYCRHVTRLLSGSSTGTHTQDNFNFCMQFFKRNSQYILSGSWSPSLLVVDAAVPSSVTSASGSTCAQKFLLLGLRLCGCVDRAGLPGSSVPSLGVRLVLSRLSWQSWGSMLQRPTSSSPSDPSEPTCSASTVRKEAGRRR